MTYRESAEPDITLVLDGSGVINQAIAGDLVADEPVAEWVGLPWVETVRHDERADIGRLVERARLGGIAGIGHVAQRFPSGLVVPLEYTMVRFGDGAGIVAVGKQLRAVAQLQSRLLDTQRVLEQDYWKLRAVETRYRMLLDSAQDALLTLDSRSLRIVEINPQAAKLLGMAPGDAQGPRDVELVSLLTEADRKTLRDVVKRALKGGPANGLLRQLKGAPTAAHSGEHRPEPRSARAPDVDPHIQPDAQSALPEQQGPWMLRASLIPSGPGDPLMQLQIMADASQPAEEQAATAEAHADLIERWPDGFVVIDRGGLVLSANAAFVDMTQEGASSALVGQSLSKWLGRPGADLTVLLANVGRFGRLRLFSTLIRGALGSVTEAELSAAGECDVGPRRIAVLVRDVGRRLVRSPSEVTLSALIEAYSERVGEAPLRTVVEETVSAVESHFVKAALRLTAGNRTAAAQLLGLSRQSLHAKLHRYALEQGFALERSPQPSSATHSG
jgi:PAS domain-containing protein/DNA-binding protein Fis